MSNEVFELEGGEKLAFISGLQQPSASCFIFNSLNYPAREASPFPPYNNEEAVLCSRPLTHPNGDPCSSHGTSFLKCLERCPCEWDGLEQSHSKAGGRTSQLLCALDPVVYFISAKPLLKGESEVEFSLSLPLPGPPFLGSWLWSGVWQFFILQGSKRGLGEDTGIL